MNTPGSLSGAGDLLPKGKYPFLQNRSALPARPHCCRAQSPLGIERHPIGSFVSDHLIHPNERYDSSGAGVRLLSHRRNTRWKAESQLYAAEIATGLLPATLLGMLIFPSQRISAAILAGVHPADNTEGGVTLNTTSAQTGSPVTSTGNNGMVKVRSDGLIWHQGIAEPQTAPIVAFPGGGSGVSLTIFAGSFTVPRLSERLPTHRLSPSREPTHRPTLACLSPQRPLQRTTTIQRRSVGVCRHSVENEKPYPSRYAGFRCRQDGWNAVHRTRWREHRRHYR